MKKIIIYTLAVLILGLNLNAQNPKLPLIELNHLKFDFGKTKIMEKRCSTLVIKNIGDTTSRLYSADNFNFPFLGKIDYIQDIKIKDSVIVNICYQPVKYGIDSQRVFLKLDTRLSHSIGLLFDVSLSMNEIMDDFNMRIEASVNAGKVFINSMLATSTVYDEAAVYSFWKSFTKNCDYTTNKTTLRNALSSNLNTGTAFYDAVLKTITDLKTRKFAKVLIALTDGEDNSSSNNLTTCITQAKANNIIVYTVGVGSDVADANLLKLAQSTGGQFFRASTSKELEDIYYKIFNLLSKNIEIYFDVLGNTPLPDLGIDCTNSDKITQMGDTVKYDVHLLNTDSTSFKNQPYTLKIKVNNSLMLPLVSNFKYNSDGTIDIKGVNLGNLDSIPLTTLKFLTLNGDSDCTNIELISIKWDSIAILPVITSDASCRLCLYSCVKNLREVQLFTPFSISQNYPNPFSDKSYIDISIAEEGNYRLSVYNQLGEKLINNLINDKLTSGNHTLVVDSKNLGTGNYLYVLETPNGNFTGIMSIIK